MNCGGRLTRAVSLARTYATRYPRPKPGTAERPAYHPPDPLANNPHAIVTPLPDENLTFIHRPPPTAPSPFSLTVAPSSPLLRPPTPASSDPLPPFIRPSADKSLPPRASDDAVAEIRRLRRLDPVKYSRGKLAKMFGCTQNFVGTIAALKSSTRRSLIRTRNLEHEKVREKWSEKKATVRAIRAKRREFW
ncbi:putative mitochondrial ribosomal protein subunit L20 [Lyophyllum shimeji]|uniref:Mitochondrial ribosomal protein subunit L20 n=1 Tax=Lyophyllum shimeji TaxID=47721 RepID=A0A9P3UKS2_LYOSH|nr:putative mitochondrial ribosomal protein subunit L20 [Lyophyllum shimeji]